jgi:putative endonuclease
MRFSWLDKVRGSPLAAQAAPTRGAQAEQMAEALLKKRGARIVERNYRCRMGEVDLIAELEGTLLFVEVRLRQVRDGNDFGGAAASITPAKQRRIIAAAKHYVADRRELPPCRFDAILLNDLSEQGIEWIQGAFEAAP